MNDNENTAVAILQATEGEHLAVVVQPKYLPSQTLTGTEELCTLVVTSVSKPFQLFLMQMEKRAI